MLLTRPRPPPSLALTSTMWVPRHLRLSLPCCLSTPGCAKIPEISAVAASVFQHLMDPGMSPSEVDETALDKAPQLVALEERVGDKKTLSLPASPRFHFEPTARLDWAISRPTLRFCST